MSAIAEELAAHSEPMEPIESAAQSIRAEVGRESELKEEIHKALSDDPIISEYLPYLLNPTIERNEETMEALKPFFLELEGLLLYNRLVYIPKNNVIKLKIL